MPTKITFIHADDFIRLTPDGMVDIEASRKILTELVSILKASREDRALIDLRKTTPTLSKPELMQLATAFATKSIVARAKIALLVSLNQHTAPFRDIRVRVGQAVIDPAQPVKPTDPVAKRTRPRWQIPK